jgi:hypothetical protein
VSEVGAADGQNELVGGEVVLPAGQRHVDEQFLLENVFLLSLDWSKICVCLVLFGDF